MITKPRVRRAEYITPEEVDVHHWLARLAVCLSSVADDPSLKSHARKTLDEFCASSACSDTLARFVRDEVK